MTPTARTIATAASPARRRRALAGLAVAVLGLAACADGDDDSDGDGGDTVAVTETSTDTGTSAEATGSVEAAEATEAAGAAEAAPVPRQSATDESVARTITVTGQGSVSVRPDVAEVQIGVRVDGASAQTVLDQATEGASALVDELESLGIPAEDIRTSGLSVFPRFGPEGSEVTGYEASNTVTVTIREIDRVGEIIDDAAAAAGEDLTIGGISFSVSDPDAARQDARTRAVDDAAARADELAAATGSSVGEVVSITEGSAATPGPVFAEEAATDAAVPIEPGSQMVTVQVTVVYELVAG